MLAKFCSWLKKNLRMKHLSLRLSWQQLQGEGRDVSIPCDWFICKFILDVSPVVDVVAAPVILVLLVGVGVTIELRNKPTVL